ncbi:MAG: hypothetical protein ACI3Z5_07765 [Paludibacteraceae bacterium]
MGLLNNIKDHFTTAEFVVAPNKKVKTICADFKKAFGCTLAIYKGAKMAEGNLTLKQLNEKTSKDVNTRSTEELKIKASMKVGEVEKLLDNTFGITVQIKDPAGKICVDNKLTIGQAARGE